MLQVLQRPNKTITQGGASFDSYWVAGHNPIVYKLESDLFPNNTQDITTNYSSVINSGGYAAFDFSTTFYTYLVLGDYVKVTGSVYNGVYRVRGFVANDIPILNVGFISTDSGSAEKYYTNYVVDVEVYTGFNFDEIGWYERPLTLKGTLRVIPNSDNEAIIDISKLVKADFTPFQINSLLNDYDHWTQTYIRFRERYQLPNSSGVLEEVTGDWDVDELGTCVTNKLVLSSSRNFGTIGSELSDNFTFSVDPLEVGYTYKVTFNYTFTAPGEIQFITIGNNVVVYSALLSGTGSRTFNYVALQDNDLYVQVNNPGGSSADYNITSITINQATPCLPIVLNCSNSVRQPRSPFGGNMGDYVLKDSQGVFESKFLNRPRRYFVGYPLTLDFILSEAAYQQWEAFSAPENLYLNNVKSNEIQFAGNGLYRYPLTISENSDVKIQYAPPSSFYFWNNGTFETTADATGITVVDADFNLARTTQQAYQGAYSLAYRITAAFDDQVLTNVNLVALKGGYVTSGRKYLFKMFIRVIPNDGENANASTYGSGSIYIVPTGYSISQADSYTSLTLAEGFTDTGWFELQTIFEATASTYQNFNIYLQGALSVSSTNANEEIFYIDNVEFSGPLIELSEEIAIVYDSACTNYEYYVKWLNPLGGYDYWLFKGAKAVGYETESTEIKRNIYGNWDSSFINADTERDYITGGAKKITTLRSTNITKDEADYVSGMAKSTKVYKYENGEWITILVQKGSLSLYSEKDKTASISIDVIETFDELSQNQ